VYKVLKKSVYAGIIVGICALIAIPVISFGQQSDEPIDNDAIPVIIGIIAMFVFILYIIFRMILKILRPDIVLEPNWLIELVNKIYSAHKLVHVGIIAGLFVVIIIPVSSMESQVYESFDDIPSPGKISIVAGIALVLYLTFLSITSMMKSLKPGKDISFFGITYSASSMKSWAKVCLIFLIITAVLGSIAIIHILIAIMK